MGAGWNYLKENKKTSLRNDLWGTEIASRFGDEKDNKRDRQKKDNKLKKWE